MTGDKKPPPTGRIWERSKEDTTCPTNLPESPCRNPTWLNNVCTTRKDHESEWLCRANQEINPITIKSKTASHVAGQSSWVNLLSCSPPGCPFPIKFLALSACVSPQAVHFQVLDKSPLSGLGRGPSSCNTAVVFTPVHHRTLHQSIHGSGLGKSKAVFYFRIRQSPHCWAFDSASVGVN